MEKVKKLVRAGLPLAPAVRSALGCSFAEFARRHEGLHRTRVNSQLTGHIAPDEKLLSALIEDLGGERTEWLAMIDKARDATMQETA